MELQIDSVVASTACEAMVEEVTNRTEDNTLQSTVDGYISHETDRFFCVAVSELHTDSVTASTACEAMVKEVINRAEANTSNSTVDGYISHETDKFLYAAVSVLPTDSVAATLHVQPWSKSACEAMVEEVLDAAEANKLDSTVDGDIPNDLHDVAET